MPLFTERDPAHSGSKTASFRAEDVAAGREFRKNYESMLNVVAAEDMPWEKCADGLIKHLVHHKLNTREMCVEAYMQFLKGGERSGKHRHMWEEVIFVVEGSGYDLHWDMKFDCIDAFQWEWAPEPKAYGWKRGDYIYVPPFTIHQHVANENRPPRDQPLSIDGADDEAGEVVFAVVVEAGHLGGFTAEQCAPVIAACARHPSDDRLGDLRRQTSSRKVIQEKERLRALHQDVVDTMVHEIHTNGIVTPCHEGEFELRADAIGARHENRVAESGRFEVKEPAE